MLSYFLKNTERKKNSKSCNERSRLLQKYAVLDSKHSKFIKEEEASRLLSSLGTKEPLSKTSLVGPLLF